MSDEIQAVPIPPEIPIHFIKGTQFRVAHASGVWFGADPHGNFHLTFYTDRTPIPKTITMKVNEQGQLIGENVAKRESKEGIVREMEIDIVMSIPALQAFHDMLGQNLQAAIAGMKSATKPAS